MAKISVIVPTYNGAYKISNILEALSKQVFTEQNLDFEVIVVIDGSHDHTNEVIEEGNFDLPHLQVITRANGGRATARNTGVKAAQGELLVFFDDDTRPIEQCLELHWQHQKEYPNSIMVGSALEDFAMMKKDIQKYRAELSRKWSKELEGRIQEDKPFLMAANCSIRRDLFEELGGFDERLRDAEDLDLGVRAIKKGISIYFKYNAIAWHDDFITCKAYIKRGRQYATSHKVLRDLKPELFASYKHHEYKAIGRGKKLIYQLITQRIWVRAIDHFNFFTIILPKKIRYKFYDILITGYVAHFPNKRI